MAQAQPFRIAHLTDLHVAASWQPVVDAMTIMATSVPALHFAAPMLNDAVSKLSPDATLPAKALLGIAGAAGSAWALS